MELKGKTAIVTGSGRGIGEGIALVLAREGANIVVNDLKAENCRDTVAKIEALGRKAIGVGADVSKKDQVDRDGGGGRQDTSAPSTSWSTTPASRAIRS